MHSVNEDHHTNAVTKDVRKIKDQKIIDRVVKVIVQIKNASSLNELSSLKNCPGILPRTVSESDRIA